MQAVPMFNLQPIAEKIDDLRFEACAPALGQSDLRFRRSDENCQPFAEGILAEVVERCCGPCALQQSGHCAHVCIGWAALAVRIDDCTCLTVCATRILYLCIAIFCVSENHLTPNRNASTTHYTPFSHQIWIHYYDGRCGRLRPSL